MGLLVVGALPLGDLLLGGLFEVGDLVADGEEGDEAEDAEGAVEEATGRVAMQQGTSGPGEQRRTGRDDASVVGCTDAHGKVVWGRRGLVPGVAFFGPGVAVHVVAVLFPEAGGVVGEEFDAADPFGGLPEVELGDDEADGEAVVWGEGLVVVFEGEEAVGVEEFVEGEVGGEALLAVDEDEFGGGVKGAGEVEEGAGGGAGEDVVEAGPAGDAVDVAVDIDPGECAELGEGEAEGILHEASDGEGPGVEVDAGDLAVVEDGPFFGFGLARGDAAGALGVWGGDGGARGGRGVGHEGAFRGWRRGIVGEGEGEW